MQRDLIALLRAKQTPRTRVRELRRAILLIDPDACIYASWGGDIPADWAPVDPQRPATAYAPVARKERK